MEEELDPSSLGLKAEELDPSAIGLEPEELGGDIGGVSEPPRGSPWPSFMEVVSKPFQAVEPYTAAPVRAAIGGIQEGKSIPDIGKQTFEQFLAGKDLPTTPSGEEISYRAARGMGIDPAFAEETARISGPIISGGADLLNVIPTRAVTSIVKNIPRAAQAAGRGIEAAYDIATNPLKKKFLQAGEMFTFGKLKSPDAMGISDRISTFEHLFPGTENFGPKAKAGRELGALREQFPDTKIPGSGEKLVDLSSNLTEGMKNELNQTNVPAFTGIVNRISGADKVIEGKIPLNKFVPTDANLSELDMLLDKLRGLEYTGKGTKRAFHQSYARLLRDARKMVNEEVKKAPLGTDLLAKRQRYRDLSEAGKGQGTLVEIATRSGALGSLAGGAMYHPAIAPAAILFKSVSPRSYYQAIGLARLPKEIVAGPLKILNKAYESKNMLAIREALNGMAEANPVATERLLRSITLGAGRPDESPEFSRIEEELKKVKAPPKK